MAEIKSIVTPEFRLSFPNLFVPQANKLNPAAAPKYSMTMLFPQTTDISALKALAKDAATAKWGADVSKWPKKFRNPIQDGNNAEWDGYSGKWFIRAATQIAPGIVDQALKPIQALESKRVYAGCWCRANVHCYAYDKAGNVGVAFGFDGVQLIRDDQPFSGGFNAAKAFSPVETGEDNPGNYDPQPVGAGSAAGGKPSANPFD